MEILARQLRQRAEALGLSNAEVARQLGLSERRYSHYAAGKREPDLAMVVRIAKALGTTPNELLGFGEGLKGSKRAALLEQLAATAQGLPPTELEIILLQTQAWRCAGVVSRSGAKRGERRPTLGN